MKLWRERIAFSICGMTVSSKPIIPGKTGLPDLSFLIRFAHFVFDAQTGVICLFEFTKCFCSFHGFIIVSPAIRRYPCFPRFGNATPKIKFGPAITANQYPGMRMPSLWGVDQTAWTKVKDGCDRQFFRRLTSAGVR